MKRPTKTALIMLSAAALLVAIALPALAEEPEEQVLTLGPLPESPSTFFPAPSDGEDSGDTSGGGGNDGTSGGGGGTSGGAGTSRKGGATIGTLDRPTGGVPIRCWDGAKYVLTPSQQCSSDNMRTNSLVTCTQAKTYHEWSATMTRSWYSKGEACHKAAGAACEAVKLAAPTSGTDCGGPTVCIVTKTRGDESVTIWKDVTSSMDAACHQAAKVACKSLYLTPPTSGTDCGPAVQRLPSYCANDPGDGSVTCSTERVCELRSNQRCPYWLLVQVCPDPMDERSDLGMECHYRWINMGYRRCSKTVCEQREVCTCNCPRCTSTGAEAFSRVDGVQMSRSECQNSLNFVNRAWAIACGAVAAPSPVSKPCRANVPIGGQNRNMPCDRPYE